MRLLRTHTTGYGKTFPTHTTTDGPDTSEAWACLNREGRVTIHHMDGATTTFALDPHARSL
jgi:hypothetical protein